MDKPKKCAYCNRLPYVGRDSWDWEGKMFFVICPNIRCKMCGPNHKTEAGAIRAWNHITERKVENFEELTHERLCLVIERMAKRLGLAVNYGGGSHPRMEQHHPEGEEMTEAKPLFKAEIGEIQDSISGLEPDDTVITNEEVNCLIATIDAHDARIAEQDRRIGELEEALRFYAGGASARHFHDGIYEINLAPGEGGHVKLGTRARVALKGAKDE